jgi:PAS domain S-box-containing protein
MKSEADKNPEQLLEYVVKLERTIKKQQQTIDNLTKKNQVLLDFNRDTIADKFLLQTHPEYGGFLESFKDEYFFFRHDLEGVFFYISSSISQILGFTPEEFKFHYSESLTDNPINKLAKQRTNQSILGNKQPPYEIEVLNKEGKPLRLEVFEVPVMDADNNCLFVEGIAHDITRRKTEENKLKELIKTAQLKTEELEEIVYAAGHDLKSPLINIQGFAQELGFIKEKFDNYLKMVDESNENFSKLKTLGHDVGECQKYIDCSVLKMQRLLEGLLQMCRMGQQTLSCKTLDPNLIFKGIFNSLNFQISQKNIQVQILDLPLCYADSSMIERAFTNIVENAIKYMPADKENPRIRVSGEITDEGVLYCITDNGTGISIKDKDRVFRMFSRLSPETAEGEGLGLSIVQRVVHLHGGKVWLESVPGNGCTFFILLENISGQSCKTL